MKFSRIQKVIYYLYVVENNITPTAKEIYDAQGAAYEYFQSFIPYKDIVNEILERNGYTKETWYERYVSNPTPEQVIHIKKTEKELDAIYIKYPFLIKDIMGSQSVFSGDLSTASRPIRENSPGSIQRFRGPKVPKILRVTDSKPIKYQLNLPTRNAIEESIQRLEPEL